MAEVDRRQFVRGAAMAPVAAQLGWLRGREKDKRLLLVGTQTLSGTSKGIYAYRWEPETGELHEAGLHPGAPTAGTPGNPGLAAESENPTYLAVDPEAKYLFAANELDDFGGEKSGAVSAFAIDAAAAKLTPINEVSALGAGTCNVTVDHEGRSVFCANYVGGSVSSFVINPNGQISDAVSHFQYQGHGPNQARQEAPHAHRVTVSPDNRFLLVNDLGLDCIHIYHLDAASAKLTPNDPPEWKSAPGSGPRALRFHPNGKIAYCVCEMAANVVVLNWDAKKGTLKAIQTVSLVPDSYHGPERGCDIVVTRSGRFAYAADRDYDCLVSFAVDPQDGKLTMLARTSCGGQVPRDLALDPTEKWVLAANTKSDNIAVFARDETTGKLAETGKSFPQAKPQCLVWA